MSRLLIAKLTAIPIRMVDLLRFIPLRGKRIIHHIGSGWRREDKDSSRSELPTSGLGRTLFWWVELLLLLFDLLGIGEWYEQFNDLFKFNSRPLSDAEHGLVKSIFKDSIAYERIRIDEYALLGPRYYQFCYVSFNIINGWGRMHEALLIHEMMHVWQYQKLGITYISKSLAAQRSVKGYNYGGLPALAAAKEKGKLLTYFNYEQQADIVADYFRLRNGRSPLWGNAVQTDLPVYEYFIAHLDHPY